MNIFRFIFMFTLTMILYGCAHQMSIDPNLNAIQSFDPTKKINKKLGYYFVENKEKEVITAGGGGEKVRYKPYKDLEEGLKKVFNNTFRSVSPLRSESDRSAEDVDLIAEIKVSTTSYSHSAVTWPPTQFGVNLSCKVKDISGEQIATIQVNGEGTSEFNEWFLSNKGLSGKRAAEDLLNKFQALIAANKKLNSIFNEKKVSQQ